VGQLKVTVGFDELFTTTEAEDLERKMDEKRRRAPVVPAAQKPGEHSAGADAEASDEGGIPPQTSSNTLDLRGLRVHEALDAVDQFLDRAFQRREPGVYLIHGHGTGALKAAVREHLRTSPYGSSFRPGRRGEGGDGVTVVTVA
jgi:DNA mismatch repair protein MutS2